MKRHGIDGEYRIDVSGRKEETHDYVLFDKTRPAMWAADDSAWDYYMFPTNASRFLEDYFNPQYPVEEYATWARDCIAIIKNTYK